MYTKIFIFVACATVFLVESKPLEQLGPLETCALENGITLETDSLVGTAEEAELAVICILEKVNATLKDHEYVIFNTLLVLLRQPAAEDDASDFSNEGTIAEEEPKLDNPNLEASKSINKRDARKQKKDYQRGTVRRCFFNPVTCF